MAFMFENFEAYQKSVSCADSVCPPQRGRADIGLLFYRDEL